MSTNRQTTKSKVLVLPGINIQWPWSKLILDGTKTVETRNYAIPSKYIGKQIALIETPGPRGKKAGISTAKILGIISVTDCFRYESYHHWLSDQKRHQVDPKDPTFAYRNGLPKWGWKVTVVRRLRRPAKAPYPRGIVFASRCEITSN